MKVFEQIAQELAKPLYKNYAYSLTRNMADAEDLVNDIVLIVHKKIDSFTKAHQEGYLDGYLVQSIRNEFLTRKKRERELDIYEVRLQEESDSFLADTERGRKVLQRLKEDESNDNYYPLLFRRVKQFGGIQGLSDHTGIPYITLHKGVNKYKTDLKNVKKILLVGNRNSGVGYHRIAKPYHELRQTRNDILITMSDGYDERCHNHDIVVFNRVISGTYAQERAIFGEMRAQGQKIIIDIDDYWELPPGHLLENYYRKEGMTGRIVQNIKEADIVTTTNEVLALKILPLNKNVVVIPNAINENDLMWKPLPQPFDKYRFGYFGSAAHTTDVPILRKACNLIHRDNPNYQLKLIGFSEQEPATHLFEEVLTSRYTCRQGDYVRIEKADVNVYGGIYNWIDCALAPLSDTLFNRCKSNLKILEAAAHKLPIICSKIHPYYGADFDHCVLFAESEYDWYKQMKKLIKNPELGRQMGARAHEVLLKKYTYKQINKLRSEII